MDGGPPDPALGLVSGTNPFPQTGAWNMFDITRAPISGTFGLFSRYSAARVNPHVAMIGVGLCSVFQLSSTGRRNIDIAVEKLKVVGTLGKTLEMGFGIEDIVREMTKFDAGRLCVALCSALTECYSESVAVDILLEMARLVNVGGQFMPSSQSWRDLLNACAGTLSATRFPIIAEHHMRLTSRERWVGACYGNASTPGIARSCSDPKDIAVAMQKIALLTRGEIKSVTFLGGNDTGWLAAVAQWFFDLKVVMYEEGTDDGDGEPRVLHQNCNIEDAQVIIYAVPGGDMPQRSLSVIGHQVTLSDIRRLFRAEPFNATTVIISGRLDWKDALRATFGSDFEELLKMSENVGGAIGSAATIYKALAQADDAFPPRYRAACTSYCDSSYGRGFISNVLFWFPELKPIKRKLEEAASSSLSSARKRYESSIGLIRVHCNCLTCTAETTGHTVRQSNDSGDSDDASYTSDRTDVSACDPDKVCLVVLLETIISLSRALSNVLIEDKALQPARSGFEYAYEAQMTRRRNAQSGMQVLQDVGQIAFCLDFDDAFSPNNLQSLQPTMDLRMHSILSLFSGRKVPLIGGDFAAITSNGITVFLGCLQGPTDSREDMSRIHIIPGRITHDGKNYSKLTDQPDLPTTPNVALLGADLCSNKLECDSRPELIIQEKNTGLMCSLQFDPSIRTGPANLVRRIASGIGLINCHVQNQRRGTCARGLPVSEEDVQTAMTTSRPLKHGPHRHKSIYIFDCREMDSIVPLIAGFVDRTPGEMIYILRKECTACCLEAILCLDEFDTIAVKAREIPGKGGTEAEGKLQAQGEAKQRKMEEINDMIKELQQRQDRAIKMMRAEFPKQTKL